MNNNRAKGGVFMIDLYTAVALTTILLLGITACDAGTNRLLTKDMQHWAVIACALIAGATLGEWGGVMTNGASAALIPLHRLAKLAEFCCVGWIGVAVGRAYGVTKYFRFAMAGALIHTVFQCVAAGFGWVFRIDSQNVYHREALYGIYVAAFLLSIIYGFAAVIRSGKEYQTGIDTVMVLTLLMLAIGVGIQFIYSNIRIDFLCIAIGNMLLYSRCCRIVLQLDAVTHLLNRRCYDTALGNLGSRAAVLFFDINRFKHVNDTYGHTMGDVCLRRVGQLLRSVYGRYGSCFRIGGDEFCVLLEDRLDEVEALNRAFAQGVDALRQEDARMPDVAIGYAYYLSDTCHIQQVIEEADAMMYRNKAAAAPPAP